MTVKWFNWSLKLCPKFQIQSLIFRFSEVPNYQNLLNEHIEKNMQRENISSSIYV